MAEAGFKAVAEALEFRGMAEAGFKAVAEAGFKAVAEAGFKAGLFKAVCGCRFVEFTDGEEEVDEEGVAVLGIDATRIASSSLNSFLTCLPRREWRESNCSFLSLCCRLAAVILS